MDPFTIAMLASAASSAAGVGMGVMNAQQGAAASRVQNDIAMRRFYQQQRLAALQEEMATASTRNARGDVTEYVPGVGWVERPSDTTRGLTTASDQEARLRLTQDLPRDRRLREADAPRKYNEGALADATLGGMNEGQQSVEDLRSALISAGVARATGGNEDMRKRIGLVSLRSGTGGQEALAKLGRQGMADTRTAIADAKLEAPSEFNNRRNARVNPRLNQYMSLVSRASSPSGVQFQPTNLDERLSDTTRSRSNMAPQSLGSAMSLDAPPIAFREDRTPVALDSLGQYLLGLGVMARREGLGGQPGSRGNPYSGSTPYTNNPAYLQFGNTRNPVSYQDAWASSGWLQ